MLDDAYRKQLDALLQSTDCDIALSDALFQAMSRRRVPTPVPSDLRRFVRRHFGVEAILELIESIPTIPRPRRFYRTFTKDVSRSGLAFLHSEQLYPGETPTLWLPTGKFRCQVTRCCRHNSRCYEIGASFCGRESERERPAGVGSTELSRPDRESGGQPL